MHASPASTSRLQLPERIGKYRIDGMLGAGAMGVVYRAHDPIIERDVAIKTVRAELLADEEGHAWRQRFEQEARVAARCLHPNLVTIFDCGEEQGTPYIVMEYVKGRPLHDYRRATNLCLAASVHIVAQVLDALQVAHAAGIVHRDIKPGNVLLLDDARVKLADFGIAKVQSTALTSFGAMIGTPNYMAPEQFNGEPLDARCDIYATGVLLFELITGQRPFSGQSDAELMYHVLREAPPNPAELNSEVTPALADCVLRALAKDPEHRFPDAQAFATALTASIATAHEAETVVAPRPRPPAVTALAPSRFDPALIERIEQQLTERIGPIARTLLRRATASARDLDDLCQTLGEALNDSELAALKRVVSNTQTSAIGTSASLAAASRTGLRIEPAQLTATQRSLASYIGPMAQVLVHQSALAATSMEDFYQRLAAAIPNVNERNAFLRERALR
ncbi:MAG: serine/threonine-protein kinase [Lamprobacter sp.]|uniref:serine/threonine-protein kinase n=1 Tax=Lamprobacter sp. TaxID=3100796 RepID=UPI002B25C5EA|nr:serine/threonine-protein kinase [Lamprobacter sp.]MEA3639201.1 serine/threonine-protein kinase [Lamprobacter sp.]